MSAVLYPKDPTLNHTHAVRTNEVYRWNGVMWTEDLDFTPVPGQDTVITYWYDVYTFPDHPTMNHTHFVTYDHAYRWDGSQWTDDLDFTPVPGQDTIITFWYDLEEETPTTPATPIEVTGDFADEDDLVCLLPSIYKHGVEYWGEQIVQAENDIKEIIKLKWYNKAYNDSLYNSSLLVGAQWKDATLYRALYRYILPQLSQFRVDGDSFSEMMKHYKAEYNEEMAHQFELGIQYDRDEDNEIDPLAEEYRYQTRLYR